VQQQGEALQFAADELRADVDIVLTAVKANGLALRHAAPELRDDIGVVNAAVQQNGEALEHATKRLRGNRHLVTNAVTTHGAALRFAANAIRGDPEIVLLAMKQPNKSRRVQPSQPGPYKACNALQYAAAELKRNRTFMLEAASLDDWALGHADDTLKADPAFVLEALQRRSAHVTNHPCVVTLAVINRMDQM